MSEQERGMTERQANEALREIEKGRMTIARAKSISKSALESGDENRIRDAYMLINNEYNRKKDFCFHVMKDLAKVGIAGASAVIVGLWESVRRFYSEVETCKSTIDALVANRARSGTSAMARFMDPPVQSALSVFNWATGSNNPVPESPVGDYLREGVADTFTSVVEKLGYTGVLADKVADQIRDGVLTVNDATVELCKVINRVSFSGLAENYLYTIMIGLFVAYVITTLGVYFTVRVPRELTQMNMVLMQRVSERAIKGNDEPKPENLETAQPTGETPQAREPDATPTSEPANVAQNTRQGTNLRVIRTRTPPRGPSNRTKGR